MTLSSLQADPAWDAEAYEETVDAVAALAADESVEIRVWGADWCGDCRSELPAFGAALEAAEFPDERLHVHPVDEDKDGDLVDEYAVDLIPTVVVERREAPRASDGASGQRPRADGTELARFVESEALPAPVHLANELREAGALA